MQAAGSKRIHLGGRGGGYVVGGGEWEQAWDVEGREKPGCGFCSVKDQSV